MRSHPHSLRFMHAMLAATLLAALAGYFGESYWVFELFSHFTAYFLALCLVASGCFLYWRRPAPALIALLLLGYFGMQFAALWRQPELDVPTGAASETLTLLQFNTHYSDPDQSERQQWVLDQAKRVDVLVLLEVTDRWKATFAALQREFPYHIEAPMRGYRGVAVYSKLPRSRFFMELTPGTEISHVRMEAHTPRSHQPISLVVIHPPPPVLPSFADLRNIVLYDAADRVGADRSRYRLFAGDFNSTLWSPVFEKVEQRSQTYSTYRGRGPMGSWPSFVPSWMGLGIDQLLVSRAIAVESKTLGPANGSDHRPVITTLRLR